jgi:hypothetical protein
VEKGGNHLNTLMITHTHIKIYFPVYHLIREHCFSNPVVTVPGKVKVYLHERRI